MEYFKGRPRLIEESNYFKAQAAAAAAKAVKEELDRRQREAVKLQKIMQKSLNRRQREAAKAEQRDLEVCAFEYILNEDEEKENNYTLTPEDVESIIEALQDEYRDDGIDFIGRLPKNFIKKSLRRLGGRWFPNYRAPNIPEYLWRLRNIPGIRPFVDQQDLVAKQMIQFLEMPAIATMSTATSSSSSTSSDGKEKPTMGMLSWLICPVTSGEKLISAADGIDSNCVVKDSHKGQPTTESFAKQARLFSDRTSGGPVFMANMMDFPFDDGTSNDHLLLNLLDEIATTERGGGYEPGAFKQRLFDRVRRTTEQIASQSSCPIVLVSAIATVEVHSRSEMYKSSKIYGHPSRNRSDGKISERVDAIIEGGSNSSSSSSNSSDGVTVEL